MVRPCKLRLIYFQPGATYYKPQGVPLRQLEELNLTVDELEAIRLKYSEDLDQVDCAAKMNISQSTFQRILTSANKKIADALTQGKAIKIEGGHIQLPRGFKRRFRHRRHSWSD